MVASRETFPLLAELLADQQRLDTPVARFASAHAAGNLPPLIPRPSTLIPLSAPRPGEQYAFEVDLDSCTGCKSCVAACHSLNGLDEEETWRDVGLIVGGDRRHPFTQTVTTACHHCADPACLNGCPVLAYEKDPATGIVRHLDDQCIGCSYCILKCPYDVPKFSKRLGIVRKCDMCHSRLAEGEAPACAQACPTHAIRIINLECGDPAPLSNDNKGAIPLPRDRTANGIFPPTTDPSYTRPTTRYITRRPLPEYSFAADAAVLRPQPPHWPLVIMLTLVPTAIGLALAGLVAASVSEWSGVHSLTLVATNRAACLLGAAGLVASLFHLGQPRRAWRIFLGWRKSWLSREAIVLGLWFVVATLALVFPALTAVSAAVGLAGLGCSAMIYVDTRRQAWRWMETFPRFFGTTTIVALAIFAPMLAAFALLAKLAWESRSYFPPTDLSEGRDGRPARPAGRAGRPSLPPNTVSARLLRGPLRKAVALRDLLGLVAVIGWLTPAAPLAFAIFLAGEVTERYLFFRAVDAPKMPGLPA